MVPQITIPLLVLQFGMNALAVKYNPICLEDQPTSRLKRESPYVRKKLVIFTCVYMRLHASPQTQAAVSIFSGMGSYS